jgi:hypothetical protein
VKLTASLLLLLLAAPADLSTPKSAARSLFDAINAGDRAAVAASLYAADDAQANYTNAMADMIVAGKSLGDAARRQFGPAGEGIGMSTLDPATAAKLDQATVQQTGDSARIMVPGQPRPMSFRRRSDGTWGLVVFDATSTTQPDIAKQTKLVRLMADAMQISATEIAKGTFKDAGEATTAIQQRLHAVMLSFHRPATTRSATMPATTQASP